LQDDPAEFEIRAAAQASGGDFSQAAMSERAAIKRATNLHWDLTPLKERLASYESGAPWFGSLLAL
jgi:hypothetical protein